MNLSINFREKPLLIVLLTLLLCVSTLIRPEPAYAAPLTDAQISVMIAATEERAFNALNKIKPGLGDVTKLIYSGDKVVFGAKDVAKIAQAAATGGNVAAQKELASISQDRIREAYFDMLKAGVKYAAEKAVPATFAAIANNPARLAKLNLLVAVVAGVLEPEDIALSSELSPAERARAYAAVERFQRAEQDQFWTKVIEGKTPNSTELPVFMRDADAKPTTSFIGSWRIDESRSGKVLQITHNGQGYNVTPMKYSFLLKPEGRSIKGKMVLSIADLQRGLGRPIPTKYHVALYGKVVLGLTITLSEDGKKALYVFDGCNWEIDRKTQKVTIIPRPGVQTLQLTRQ